MLRSLNRIQLWLGINLVSQVVTLTWFRSRQRFSVGGGGGGGGLEDWDPYCQYLGSE